VLRVKNVVSKFIGRRASGGFANAVLQRVGAQSHIVIDGLRFPEDRAYFVENVWNAPSFTCIFSASDEVRRSRYAESAARLF